MALKRESIGEVNKYLVLEYVRDNQRTTRPEIARALNLSQATVSRVVADLLQRRILLETGDTTDSTGGRPRAVLTLNVESACVVGIDLGGTNCHGALSGLDGEILIEHFTSLADAGGAFEALLEVWTTIKAAADDRGIEISALAVGVPAVIDPDSELAVRGPNVGWSGFNIVERVRAFGVPFIVDNDVNLAAIAEGEIGQAAGARDFAVLSIGTGLGGAVVTNGRLARGRRNAAGEIGAIVPDVRMLAEDRAHGIGGLESVLSGAGIAARAKELVATDAALASELGSEPTARDVISAALAGQEHSRKLLDDVINALAQAVISLAAVIDPEVVVIDGGVGRALQPVLPEVTAVVARHIATPPRLAISELGPNSTVRGALSGALNHLRQSGAPNFLTDLISEGGLS